MIIVFITSTIIAKLVAGIDMQTWSRPMAYFIWGAALRLIGNQALVECGSSR